LARDEEAVVGADGGIASVGGLDDGDGDPMGGIAGLGSFFSGIRSGAVNALNLITYYKMKARAGTVGRKGLAPVLREVKEEVPGIKIHLVGHSFGGRLVAATALGESRTATVLPVDSMTLLQAAFSHNAFARDWEGSRDGYYRDVYDESRIVGPTLVTYTSNDKANRLAYPLASRLARQVAAAFGDANDKFGAIGANGAQNTPEAVAGSLLSRDSSYDFDAGVVYNLEGSDYIDDHMDVAGREIANAIVAAVNAT
jgi:pimeloyl-ACP methyl ester carboxylesterase